MKKFILISIIAFCGNVLLAGSSDNNLSKAENHNAASITGKVIDKVSGEKIAGAEIRIDDKIVYTDLDGNFSVNVSSGKNKATVSFISYADATVEMSPYTYNKIEIELESK